MSNRLHIVMYVPGLPFNSKTLTSSSLGGSETAGLSMARELEMRGHKIYLFCNIQEQQADGDIEYIPMQMFNQFVTFIHHDVCIVQRVPEIMRSRNQAKLTVLWLHDMTLARHHDNFVSSLWNTDKIMLLSQFMVDHYKSVHGETLVTDDLIWKTRNGIDLDMFPPLSEPIVRDRKLLLYAARPERGLDYLLETLFPKMLERDPELILGICGYENQANELKDYYDHCADLARKLGNNFVNFGALAKPELYKLYSRAGVYVYPTPTPSNPKFMEISCITLMECQRAGLPVVATASGALPETLNAGAGFLVDGAPGQAEHDDVFVGCVLELVQDDELHRKCSETGQNHALTLSWTDLAEQWEQGFIDAIGKKTEPARLIRHFQRIGDHCAAGNLGADMAVTVPNPPHEATEIESGVIARWITDSKLHRVVDNGQMQILRKSHPEVEFTHATFDAEQVDGVVLVNALEYEAFPWTRLQNEIMKVKVGGVIMCCVPVGEIKVDGRLWNFESSDVEDMCSKLPKFDMYAQMVGANKATGEPIGHLFFKFEVQEGIIVKPINMERKLTLQSPRETVSVNIIAGGAKVEDTLHWCLKSVVPIADEIIIADTGMTEEARRIANQYPVTIIPASDPLKAGFETPRNEALKESTCDWILWIDCDEKLIGAEYLTKYLRNNAFDGYGIKQHHFGIGINHAPDMPVRLFRNNRGIKFIGMIHEHPEKGLNKGPGNIVVLSDVNIMHVGYDSESTRAGRFSRNVPLLKKDRETYPDRILQKHFVMRDNMILVNSILSQNGNQITDEIKNLCDETIELWRKHFKGGCELVGIDSLQYYNNACKVLNIGVDVAFQITAGRDGYGANLNGQGMRFANEDDLMSEIKLQTEHSTGHYLRDNF